MDFNVSRLPDGHQFATAQRSNRLDRRDSSTGSEQAAICARHLALAQPMNFPH
jgi:hypothetical protein